MDLSFSSQINSESLCACLSSDQFLLFSSVAFTGGRIIRSVGLAHESAHDPPKGVLLAICGRLLEQGGTWPSEACSSPNLLVTLQWPPALCILFKFYLKWMMGKCEPTGELGCGFVLLGKNGSFPWGGNMRARRLLVYYCVCGGDSLSPICITQGSFCCFRVQQKHFSCHFCRMLS